MLKFISNGPNENEFLYEAAEICDDSTQNKKRNISKKHPSILFRERGRKFQLTIRTNILITSCK